MKYILLISLVFSLCIFAGCEKSKIPQGGHAGDSLSVIIAGQEVKFHWCPPTGERGFLMGSPANEKGRSNGEMRHKVVLTQGYWLMETEVTQGLWEGVMGSNPSYFKKEGDYPVEKVSWEDAQAFMKKVNAGGSLPKGWIVALPTEAQWEYACRADVSAAYAGDLNAMAWYSKNSQNSTHPVGELASNSWGLYDMHGNVWEWCADWYADYETAGTGRNPIGPGNGQGRVIRSGGWGNHAGTCRSASRDWSPQGTRLGLIGLRLSLQPSP